MTRCRLLVDLPAPGAWNMAVDEFLLAWTAENRVPVFRLYRWDEPTLSLGYFQRFDDRRQHPASMACPVVRRPTGGGAIVHDAELTYSIAVPVGHPLAVDRLGLYRQVHQTLIETLSHWDGTASLWDSAQPLAPETPFLCFLRRATGDVVQSGQKVGGSAQRRTAGAVLQHGSVLIERSAAAPELPGLNDLLPIPVNTEELIAAWTARLGSSLALEFFNAPLDQSERQQCSAIEQGVYGSDAWTIARRGQR